MPKHKMVTVETANGSLDIPAALLTNKEMLTEYLQDQAKWDNRIVARGEQEMLLLDDMKWRNHGPMPTVAPSRSAANMIDHAEPGISISPQRWATRNVYVNPGQPLQLWPSIPTMSQVEIFNQDPVNTLYVAPDEQSFGSGDYVPVASQDQFSLSCSGSGWGWAPAGVGSVGPIIVVWTWFESPVSHMTPKGRHGED